VFHSLSKLCFLSWCMQWALGDKNSLAWLLEKLVCVNRRFEVIFQNVYGQSKDWICCRQRLTAWAQSTLTAFSLSLLLELLIVFIFVRFCWNLSGKMDVMRCYNVCICFGNGCLFTMLDVWKCVYLVNTINLQCYLFLFWNASKNVLNFENGPNFKNGLNFENGPNF
jgi:hypothetical protein